MHSSINSYSHCAVIGRRNAIILYLAIVFDNSYVLSQNIDAAPRLRVNDLQN